MRAHRLRTLRLPLDSSDRGWRSHSADEMLSAVQINKNMNGSETLYFDDEMDANCDSLYEGRQESKKRNKDLSEMGKQRNRHESIYCGWRGLLENRRRSKVSKRRKKEENAGRLHGRHIPFKTDVRCIYGLPKAHTTAQ